MSGINEPYPEESEIRQEPMDDAYRCWIEKEKWKTYEVCKRSIWKTSKSNEEYEREIKILAERLGV